MLPPGRPIEARLRPANGFAGACAAALSQIPLARALRDGVFVGLFDLREWGPWLAEALDLLSPEEARKAASRRASVDRDELALAYALHRLVLGHVLECIPEAVPVERDAQGCPRVRGYPLSTSLSHAGRGLAVAVSGTRNIGVDLEPRERAPVMGEIADYVLHAHDATPCHANGQLALDELLALWVRKEAVLKAAGIGMQIEMNTFPAPNNAVLTLPRGSLSRVAMLDAGEEWFAAIACQPDATVLCSWLHPTKPPRRPSNELSFV